MVDKPIFILDTVNFSVDGLNILKDISLDINPNDFIVLLGPSGAGKSTLLRLLNGLNSPTSGYLKYHDEYILDIDHKQLRKKVGMVFQSPAMISGTVKDNLVLTHKWEKHSDGFITEELNDILAKVGLNTSFLEKDAKSLSGGEQQRIALARVLLNKPEVLLLDEPTSSLDPQLAIKILDLICKLSEDLKLTVVLVTHHHAEVEHYAKKVIFMVDGRIVEIGGKDIIKQPKTTAAQAFIAREDK